MSLWVTKPMGALLFSLSGVTSVKLIKEKNSLNISLIVCEPLEIDTTT